MLGADEAREAASGKAEGAQDGDGRRLVLAMTANLQRADMNPIEEAPGFERLKKEFGMTQVEIARAIGKSPALVDFRLDLLELDPEIQDLYAVRKLPISEKITYALLAISDRDARVRLARHAALRKMTAQRILANCTMLMNRIERENPYRQLYNHAKKKEGEKEVGPEPVLKAAKLGDEDLKHWNALQQVGSAPHWTSIKQAALKTCQACALYDLASDEVCKECPLVEFIKLLIK